MAAGDIIPVYAGAATAITCTLASLANGSARECAAVDNTSALYLDALVSLQAKLQAGTPAAGANIAVYAYGASESSTPKYPDKITGSDAAITPDNPPNLRLLGMIFTSASGALTWKGGPWSVCQALGLPVLPPKWGIVVVNSSGFALDATEGNHFKGFQGINQHVS